VADAVIDNIFLVNAPAGSGKTTRIRYMIINHIIANPNDNILCITYTNRAAEELKKGLTSEKVFFGTIHSFLHGFIGIYFSHKQIIDLYFEVYGEEIRNRIANIEVSSNITKSNEKYIEKYGSLTYETVQQNIKAISYNETQFNSLYYGGLSHDDLISFAKIILDKFTVIKKRLSQRYQAIFIDEYQDSSANVLKLFYDAVLGTSTQLYFLGDKMQQIYKNYDGTFEEELPTLNKSIVLDINHRSIPKIIDILNGLYNDSSYKQNPSLDNIHIAPDHSPRVIICDNIAEKLETEKAKFPKALVLYLLNQKRFESIGAGNLYRQLSRMERYSFIQKYSAVDILTEDSNDNPDTLIKLLFNINKIAEYFDSGNLGGIVQLLRKMPKLFDKDVYAVTKHDDKERLWKISIKL
jgi:DNA helicase-2/ATP-dependent DNA helicase PcrA